MTELGGHNGEPKRQEHFSNVRERHRRPDSAKNEELKTKGNQEQRRGVDEDGQRAWGRQNKLNRFLKHIYQDKLLLSHPAVFKHEYVVAYYHWPLQFWSAAYQLARIPSTIWSLQERRWPQQVSRMEVAGKNPQRRKWTHWLQSNSTSEGLASDPPQKNQ